MPAFNKQMIIVIGGTMILIITAVVILFIALPKKQVEEPTYLIVTAERTNLVKILTKRGKVSPPQDIDLYLLRAGPIEKINFQAGNVVVEGDQILNLENKQLLALKKLVEQDFEIETAELERLKTILASEQQWLTDLTVGYSEDSFQRQRQRIVNSKTEIENTKINLEEKIKETLSRAQAALEHADLLFDEPDISPQLKFTTADPGLTVKAVFGRVTMNLFLDSWSTRLESLNENNLDQFYSESIGRLGDMADFIDNISLALEDIDDPEVSDFLVAIWGISVANGKKEINLAVSSLGNAKQNLKDSISALARAEEGLQTLLTGPTPAKINAQQRVADTAQIKADDQQTRLDKVNQNLVDINEEIDATILYASISGKITEFIVFVGDTIEAYQLLASLVLEEKVLFELELNLEELGEVEIGDQTRMKIDELIDTFLGEVIHLDREAGIALLKFKTVPEELKIDMKGEAKIVIERREQVITVPLKAIIKKSYGDVVLVTVLGQKPDERRIVTGLYDSFGNVEVVEGLNEGEKVLISL